MREIQAVDAQAGVEELILSTVRFLPPDVQTALHQAHTQETSPQGREVLGQLLENAACARDSGLPLCQDTGTAVFFVDMGEDLRLVSREPVNTGNSVLEDMLTRATARAYTNGLLRSSQCHPLTRANTGDNTPIALHLRLVPGDRLKISFLPKGGGAENMSASAMLSPAKGRNGAKKFILETVRQAGPNPCPPIIVGACIGGGFDAAPALAKEALLRSVGSPNPDPEAALLEKELLDEINALGIGPGGLGGTRTCLAVHLALAPCHIACLPVAVNIQCNSARVGTITL